MCQTTKKITTTREDIQILKFRNVFYDLTYKFYICRQNVDL